ncbi:hypothetical protein [Veillonella agrestimuris]|uniref:hypothetical protein n=1 Tax=Veillonella agrestimuris TaxID=2941340 RepID=UPI00203BC2DD|nr:hypothetical protein [Veillonella agrestimuris]
MKTVVEACKQLDYSWLPETIGAFSLVVTGPDAIKLVEERLEKGEIVLQLPLFHYENELGWKWCALYDKEVEDYTVHVVMPLFYFVDISFVRADIDSFWRGLQERAVQGLTKMLINSSESFSYTYRKKGIPNWDFETLLPSRIEDFTLDITPRNAVSMINGSFIIAEYRKEDECTGLLLFYNEFRDEFFAELRYKQYPEIDHRLDAKTIEELGPLLEAHLQPMLQELNQR